VIVELTGLVKPTGDEYRWTCTLSCGVTYELHGSDLTTEEEQRKALGSGSLPRRTVYVHHEQREDGAKLYAFRYPGERDLFRRLLSIKSVGPAIALKVACQLGTDGLRKVRETGDKQILRKIPGVGEAVAMRIMMELPKVLR